MAKKPNPFAKKGAPAPKGKAPPFAAKGKPAMDPKSMPAFMKKGGKVKGC